MTYDAKYALLQGKHVDDNGGLQTPLKYPHVLYICVHSSTRCASIPEHTRFFIAPIASVETPTVEVNPEMPTSI